jgi:hypothetical protein
MVIIGLWQGQGFISSLASNIPNPQNISYCGNYLKGLIASNGNINSNYSNYGNSYYGGIHNLSNCTYSEIENKYSLKNIVDEIIPLQTKVSALQKDLQNLESQSYQVQTSISQQKQDYTIALQEKIANEDGTIYDRLEVKSDLSQAELHSSNIKEQKTKIQSEVDGINKSILEIAIRNQTAINNVFDEYASAVRLVGLERSLLLFLLISPALFFTIKKYFKHKRENSQYTIIWAAISTIFALLFSQVFFAFIYKILPQELIVKLIQFFKQFAFLATLLQYLTLFIVPVIFGGIVYWIQKKVYNKEVVMIRSLKNHKCPSCTMNLRESDRYCPICHYQIKEKCTNCGGDRITGLAYCPSCGGKSN